MLRVKAAATVGITLALFGVVGCSSGESIPDGISPEMYEVGCEALDVLDDALDANDLFSQDLKDQMKTLSTKARDASRESDDEEYEKDYDVLSGIQGATIGIGTGDGDAAMESIDSLREVLGKE